MGITNRELTDDLVLRRILELLKEKGKTEKDMVECLGIGNGAFTVNEIHLVKLYHQMQLGQKECLMQTAKWFVNVQVCGKNT